MKKIILFISIFILNITLHANIENGKDGYDSNAMPKIPLSEEEIKDVSEYINSLQPFKVWMKK